MNIVSLNFTLIKKDNTKLYKFENLTIEIASVSTKMEEMKPARSEHPSRQSEGTKHRNAARRAVYFSNLLDVDLKRVALPSDLTSGHPSLKSPILSI